MSVTPCDSNGWQTKNLQAKNRIGHDRTSLGALGESETFAKICSEMFRGCLNLFESLDVAMLGAQSLEVLECHVLPGRAVNFGCVPQCFSKAKLQISESDSGFFWPVTSMPMACNVQRAKCQCQCGLLILMFRCSNFETNKSLCFTSKAPDCLLQPWVLVHLPSTGA